MSELQGSCILLHGPPKSGKTTIASSFPIPLFFATEMGHGYIPEAQRKRLVRLSFQETKKHFNGWAKFKAILSGNKIAEMKKVPKTIVIDTIGNLYHMCFDWVCNDMGIQHPADAPHGKGWAAVKREFIKGMGALADRADEIKATILFVSHSQTDTMKAGNNEYHQIKVSMPGQARDVIMPNPDHIWYLGVDGDGEDAMIAFKDNRALWLHPTSAVEAGCRDPHMNLTRIHPLQKTKQYAQIVLEMGKHTSKREK